MEKQYTIGETLANTILNYLSRQPWMEVNQMMCGLQVLKTIPVADIPITETEKPVSADS